MRPIVQPSQERTLRVLAWNVYTGHKPAAVRRELADMIAARHPDAIVLTEATHQQRSLGALGYNVIHLPSRAVVKGNQPETADTAILVKPSVKILRHWAMHMTTFWKGPDHGWPHDPRVYQVVRIRKGRQTWRILGDHQPFGRKPVAESVRRLRKWLAAALSVPSIVIGDQNQRAPEFHDRVAADAGAHVGGARIDLAAFIGCELVSVEDLGFHGSDHRAQLYTFRATPKKRK